MTPSSRTFTLCTILDVAAALGEVYRCCDPAACSTSWSTAWHPTPQSWPGSTGSSRCSGASSRGATLTRDVPALVVDAGLEITLLEQRYLPGPRIGRPYSRTRGAPRAAPDPAVSQRSLRPWSACATLTPTMLPAHDTSSAPRLSVTPSVIEIGDCRYRRHDAEREPAACRCCPRRPAQVAGPERVGGALLDGSPDPVGERLDQRGVVRRSCSRRVSRTASTSERSISSSSPCLAST